MTGTTGAGVAIGTSGLETESGAIPFFFLSQVETEVFPLFYPLLTGMRLYHVCIKSQV